MDGQIFPVPVPGGTGVIAYGDDTGVADTYVVTASPAPAALAEGLTIAFKALAANTGASTLNVNAFGAKPITRNGTAALVGGEIAAGQILTVIYDGANWQIQSNESNVFVGDSGSGGVDGLVPAPAAGDGAAHKFLRATGAFEAIAAPDVSGAVPSTRLINTTAPLTGGGDMSADRTLAVSLATSSAPGVVQGDGATVALTAGVISTPDNKSNQQVRIMNAGSLVGTRRAVNFIAGSNVTLTIADDAGNDRVNVTVAASGGGGGSTFPFAITAPPGAGWAWQGQNPGGSVNTVDTGSSRIALTTDGAADGIASYVRSKIAGTFTITMLLAHMSGYDSTTAKYTQGSLVLTDGTALIVFGVLAYNGANYLACFKWTNNTTGSAAVTGFTANGGLGNSLNGISSCGLWLRVVEDASHRTYYVAPDGLTWVQIAQTALTDFLTTTKYGVCVRGAGGNAAAVSLMSLVETNP